MLKPAKTISQQIELLKTRNMKFKNIQNAEQLLENISYYRLKGYWWEMQDDKISHYFKDACYFEDVIELYNFDKQFRLIVFESIESIEISLRTKLIYHLSHSYGALSYLNSNIFDNLTEHSDFCNIIFNDISHSREEFILKHKINHPTHDPESWKALEILTFTTLSRLYRNLKKQLPEKNKISKEFGLNQQKYFESWLQTISLIRNIIAHHSRLWNRGIIYRCAWDSSMIRKILSYVPTQNERTKIFPILSGIIYLNNKINPNNNLKQKLIQLFKDYPNVPLNNMGFPFNWYEEPIWK